MTTHLEGVRNKKEKGVVPGVYTAWTPAAVRAECKTELYYPGDAGSGQIPGWRQGI